MVGGGPVGASAAWYLGEMECEKDEPGEVLMIYDPTEKGAHEDWSRLARLSFDGPKEEFDLSRHAVELLETVELVRSMQSGAPVIPIKPGMLFVCSPGTNMSKALARGEGYGDDELVRRSPDELEDLYPGNTFSLPSDTICYTHPVGLCVSPLELAEASRKTAEAYGVEGMQGRASIELDADDVIRVTVAAPGEPDRTFLTRRCFLFAGARNKQILGESASFPAVPDFDHTYISAISTIRYKHRNHPASPAPDSGHVAPPITLGQLDLPDICSFQANFSVVAEEWGDVLKTRLSGGDGSEVIETVANLHDARFDDQNAAMAETYRAVFGGLFPYLETETPLDFNRCVTYRNHIPAFHGTALLEKKVGESSLITTPGCFGVGVKFGPALGQAAAAHSNGQEVEPGMNVFQSGEETLDPSAEHIERAW